MPGKENPPSKRCYGRTDLTHEELPLEFVLENQRLAKVKLSIFAQYIE